MSFYRLYRPQNFCELYEQEHIRTTLENSLKKDEVAHAYIFSGPRGTGKTSTARLLSKALLCDARNNNSEPCGKCSFCLGIEQGQEMDLVEVDAASHTGVNDIRDLIEKSRFAPTRAEKKVYIIDEVHMLSRSAFNALLKTLEEPPSHLHFILCTTEIEKIPDTVISRCQRFDFHRLGNASMVEKLKKIAKKEKITHDDESLKIIAVQAEGGMRNAEVLFEQLSSELDKNLTIDQVSSNLGLAESKDVRDFMALIKDKKIKESFDKIASLEEKGVNFKQFVKKILEHLREDLLSQDTPSVELLSIVDLIKIFRKAGREIRSSVVPSLPLEVAVVKAIDKKKVKSKKKNKVKIESQDISVNNNITGASDKKISSFESNSSLPYNIKNALKASDIKKDKDEIIIETGSDFFYDVLMKSVNFQKLKDVAKKMFGDKAIVKCVMVKKTKKDLPKSFEPSTKSSYTVNMPEKLSGEKVAAILDK